MVLFWVIRRLHLSYLQRLLKIANGIVVSAKLVRDTPHIVQAAHNFFVIFVAVNCCNYIICLAEIIEGFTVFTQMAE